MSGDIWILGDTHGRFRHVVAALREHRPAALVHVGDLTGDVETPLPMADIEAILALTELWWIPGNHDTDSDAQYDALFSGPLAERNLDGRVVTIDGVRIAGLGGVFRARIWQPPAAPTCDNAAGCICQTGKADRWRGGLPRKHRSSIFPDTYYQLAAERADVLVTHEAPSCHGYGFKAIDELAQALQVETAFHGHQHDRLDYRPAWPSLGFKAYGVGFCGITDLNGQVIREGDFDRDRANRPVWTASV